MYYEKYMNANMRQIFNFFVIYLDFAKREIEDFNKFADFQIQNYQVFYCAKQLSAI